MSRPLWKGSLAFGLVSIPVELHTAVRDHRPHFRLLHATDHSPVKLDRVCVREGKAVAWADLVKGFEYAKGKFVVLTKRDFEAAAVEKTRRVDIVDFVSAADIDDRFFETPYYLTPARGGEHAYALLREAMRESERIGIAKFILRDALHLSAVEVIGDLLVLTMMRFGDELVDPASFSVPRQASFKRNELDMAKTLVASLAAEWDPFKYADDYRDNLMRIIKAKAKGKTVRLEAKADTHPPKVVDLMERLRASLEQHTRKPSSRRAAPAARKRRSTKKRTAKTAA